MIPKQRQPDEWPRLMSRRRKFVEDFGGYEIRGVVFLMLFGLVACAAGDVVSPANASSELRDWQTAAGKPLSKSEFAAVVAACEDRAKNSSRSAAIEGCLADYGLRRAQ